MGGSAALTDWMLARLTSSVALRPTISASDRSGLLYAIARVLGRNHVNLQLAKVTTLGERVEDTFLIDGPELQKSRAQLRIETELLDAIA